jgi:hypothetical protein
MFELAGLIFSGIIGAKLHTFGRKNMIILGYLIMVSKLI